MKVKILKTFYNTKPYYPGQVVELDDDEAKALLNDERKLVEKIKTPARKNGNESLTAEKLGGRKGE